LQPYVLHGKWLEERFLGGTFKLFEVSTEEPDQGRAPAVELVVVHELTPPLHLLAVVSATTEFLVLGDDLRPEFRSLTRTELAPRDQVLILVRGSRVVDDQLGVIIFLLLDLSDDLAALKEGTTVKQH
jgi:hypothetical protein